jgi:uncharacterized membrane-anchored protein YitT (DUF2179 family)
MKPLEKVTVRKYKSVKEALIPTGDEFFISPAIDNYIRKGYTAVSGCWYYNHNSKKTMESAGGYSKTRLLKFYF